MPQKSPEQRVLEYLFYFGDAAYTPLEIDDDGINYATITLTTTRDLANGLEEQINNELSAQNGIWAKIRFIDIAEGSRGKTTYVAEIVPQTKNKDEWQRITDDYLHRLPKVLKNIRKKR